MTVRLDGYFDRNFGDDYMIKTLAEHFRDVDFVIKDAPGVSDMLKAVENIRISDEMTDKTLRVIGSGFMINKPAALLIELIWLLKGRKEPDWCVGCNIEPFKSFLHKAVIRQKIKKYALVTCRDMRSLKWLQKHCRGVRVECFPDIVFGADIKKAEDGDKLGISVMNLGFGEELKSYYSVLAEVADYYIESTGKGVILLAFDAGKENDEEACRYVRSLMKTSDVTAVVHGSENEIIEAYSECRKIIGTRFHSAVLALKMEIDLYPVIYRSKMQNLLEDIGFDGGSCTVSDMDCAGIKRFLDAEEPGYRLAEKYAEKAKGHFEILQEYL